MINGRFDFQSPIGNAWELKRAWPRAELVIVDDAGHAADNAGITRRAHPRDGSVCGPLMERRTMDADLDEMTREQLTEEVRKLRGGIRAHRDSTLHELCWHHPDLWALLPEKTDPLPEVPDWPQFLQGCLHYRQSLDEQLPDAPRTNKPYKLRRRKQ